MDQHEPAKIRFVGGPTALIEFCGLRFLTDPTFDPRDAESTTGPVTLKKLAGPAWTAEELGRVDYVLLSHDQHYDNLDHAGRAMLTHARQVLTTREGAERLGQNAVGLVPWQTLALPVPNGDPILVTATPARHGPYGSEARSGPVIGFAIRPAADPQADTLYFSGDTVWYEGVAEVARWFHVTTAILNMGAARVQAAGPAPLTMTAQDAIQVARAMPHATLVPLHFEGWAHFTESRQQIQQEFQNAGLEARLRWP